MDVCVCLCVYMCVGVFICAHGFLRMVNYAFAFHIYIMTLSFFFSSLYTSSVYQFDIFVSLVYNMIAPL